jgi:hypothetical protein
MAVGVVCLQDKFTTGSGLGERMKTAIYRVDCDNYESATLVVMAVKKEGKAVSFSAYFQPDAGNFSRTNCLVES